MQENGIKLTNLGKMYIEDDLGYGGLDKDLYNALLFDENIRLKYISNLKAQLEDIYDKRPQVNVMLDQALCTPETAIKRALLGLDNFTIIGKKILCVGDDDLVSIAIGFLHRDLFPNKKKPMTKIVVFELDERIANYISEVAECNQLPIECEIVDLKEPLQLKYLNYFDCFYTDPSYTLNGLMLFLSRGIGVLKHEKGNNIFLAFGKKPLEENYEMQKELLSHGLSIKRIIDSFNEYYGASLLGNLSQMIVLGTTESTNTLISNDLDYTNPIYTRQINTLNRVFRCKNCKFEITMSTDKNTPFKTIEQLKDSGCTKCGSTKFDLLKKKKESYEDIKKSLGFHVIADFFDCSREVLQDPDLIKEFMYEAAQSANATIVSSNFHTFSPWGVSGVIIIKESHFTIHTWPEYGYAAVNLFTCGTSLELLNALKYLKEKFGYKNIEYSNLARGLFQNNHITSTIKLENKRIE